MAAPEERVVNGLWQLGKVFGKGAYGYVVEGIHVNNGKKFALKFMEKNQHWEQTERSKVATEIQALQSIRHDNVLKLFAYDLSCQYPNKDGTFVDSVLLVTELCPGGELFDILYYTSKLDQTLARTYFQQLVTGLEAIHAAGISHRDLKPQNLLLDHAYNLKIIDFGLAKILTGETGTTVTMQTVQVGTPGYQSPEIVLGREYTALCDTFACGVILFVMLCGYPPFESADAQKDSWYKKIAAKKFHRFWGKHTKAGIEDESLRELIQGCLAYQPAERYGIDLIKEDPWYNGEVLSGAELVDAMRTRHIEALAAKKEDARAQAALDTATFREVAWNPELLTPIKSVEEFSISVHNTYIVDTDEYELKDVLENVKGILEDTMKSGEVIHDADTDQFKLTTQIDWEAGTHCMNLDIQIFKRTENGPTLLTIVKEIPEDHGYAPNFNYEKVFFTQFYQAISYMTGDPYFEEVNAEAYEYDDGDFIMGELSATQ